jgi:hypothetical protein
MSEQRSEVRGQNRAPRRARVVHKTPEGRISTSILLPSYSSPTRVLPSFCLRPAPLLLRRTPRKQAEKRELQK